MKDKKFITANQLIKSGVPLALFWNTANRDKPIERDRLISYSLKRGFNKNIIETYVGIFGTKVVRHALVKDKDTMTARFYSSIMQELTHFK